jgi:uncharacterized protein (DUF486 family)
MLTGVSPTAGAQGTMLRTLLLSRDSGHLTPDILGDPMPLAAILPIILLCCSNIFMTFAWYGQLKFPAYPLALTILISWGIAFFEYCLAVPANRIGHQVYSAAQLKTMQEIITLIVFALFSVFFLGESLKWNHAVAFLFLCGAAFFSFNKW